MSLFDLYKNLQNLSADKQARWARELLASGLAEPAAATIVPRPDPAAPIPVSLMQQRLWLLEQLTPGNPFYNLPLLCFELEGEVDLPALAGSLLALEGRHASLRTCFYAVDGEPFQRLLEGPVRHLDLVDLSALPEEGKGDLVESLARAEARRLFDLDNGPLWRTTLLRLGPTRHLLIIALHHIIADAWSIGVLYRELTLVYTALCEGRPNPLPPLPVQYADFSVWQREQMQGGKLEEEIAFWKGQLQGAPELLALPTDRPHPPEPTHAGERQTADIPPELPHAIQRFAQEAGASLYMMLLAAYKGLLSRYTGATDVVVASPVASRNRLEIEGLIGFFVNTVVHRTRLPQSPTFRSLLGSVREVVLEVYEHPDLPFDKTVEALNPRRDPRYNPIYQVMMSLQNTPTPDLTLAGLKVRPRGVDSGTCQTDLILFAGMDQGRLGAVQIEYTTDLFDTATITRFMGHYLTFLAAGIAEPDRPIAELPILPEAERRQMLSSWGGNRWEERVWPEGSGGRACLHHLFDAQVARDPRATAVVHEGDVLSYGELARRSNQLARRLRALGVGPEVRVALALERSLELVVALMAVEKAGGVYVPLDPDYPAERLALLLEDAGAAVLVTQETLLEQLPDTALPRVLVDAERPALAALPDTPPDDGGVTPDNAAYIIYTSGSTGRPKGVVVSHGQASRLFDAVGAELSYGPGDVFSFFHSYAFDFSVWEIFGALLAGATVVVVPQWVVRSPEAFFELLAQERVTVLCQTPSSFRQLLPVITGSNQTLSLRYVFFAGEALEPPLLAPWYERHPGEPGKPGGPALLVNSYGITETTVLITLRQITAELLSEEPSRSRIGWPLPDLSTVVLSEAFEPVPIGVPGEICVGGAGVCRGYLDRPDLTAARFPPDPFSSLPGARLYRTGDLGRWLADGDLEFLGRIDHQVKVRGIRIELGEIEATLNRHPAVAAAAVVLAEIEPGDQRLVAYCAPTAGSSIEHGELRTFLSRTLPDAMLPSIFVELAQFPMTTSGKLDRRALPKPEAVRGLTDELVAPRNPTEEMVAEMVCDLLKLPQVGVFDNFFELGGHSLLAARLTSRLRDRLVLDLPPQLVFHHPTIAEMATEISGQREREMAGMAPIPQRARPVGVAG